MKISNKLLIIMLFICLFATKAFAIRRNLRQGSLGVFIYDPKQKAFIEKLDKQNIPSDKTILLLPRWYAALQNPRIKTFYTKAFISKLDAARNALSETETITSETPPPLPPRPSKETPERPLPPIPVETPEVKVPQIPQTEVANRNIPSSDQLATAKDRLKPVQAEIPDNATEKIKQYLKDTAIVSTLGANLIGKINSKLSSLSDDELKNLISSIEGIKTATSSFERARIAMALSAQFAFDVRGQQEEESNPEWE